MAATHYYPTSKCQQIVLAGLGLTAENYTEAERKFDEIGILVVAIRQGRKSVPSIAPLRYAGGSEDERFNRDYADIIRENLSEYCNAELLKMITPVTQPVVAEQKEETTMTASSYEIEILSHSFQSVTDAGQRVEMDGLRMACADLIQGIDQAKPSIYHEDMEHHSIMVSPGDVGEAVQRINAAGYATDEDESDGGEDNEDVTLYDGMFDEE